MNKARNVNLSAALIVVFCFFLPWVQVGCGSSRDSLSGLDLARDGHSSLWLIPVLMGLAVGTGFLRSWRGLDLGALLAFVAGILGAYLMNRERLRARDAAGLLEVRVTGWFWLGFVAAIVVGVMGAIRFLKSPKPFA